MRSGDVSPYQNIHNSLALLRVCNPVVVLEEEPGWPGKAPPNWGGKPPLPPTALGLEAEVVGILLTHTGYHLRGNASRRKAQGH